MQFLRRLSRARASQTMFFQQEESMKRATTFVFTLLVLVSLGLVAPMLAQDQLNLGDGILNSVFNGGSATPNPQQITMTIPSMHCTGSPLTCNMGIGPASGAGPHLGGSSGTYTISSAAITPVTGGYAGPFYLTLQPDGSSVVTQTEQIQFNYTSPQGTLTGLLNFATVSPSYLTPHGYWADVLGTFIVTGGTFAQYFPSGGNVHISLGVTHFPLQLFPTVPRAFTPVELETGTIIPNTACSQQSSNSSNFNGTPIPGGDYIWFNANFSLQGGNVHDGTTLNLTLATIQFTANGTPYVLPAPNATVTFKASAHCASTNFNPITNTWETTVPLSGSDEILLDGLAYQVPAGGLPGGINPIVWKGTFSSNTSGLSIQWKWGAAVYTQFSTNYNTLGVKVTHQNDCTYSNGDHAGTPENFKNYVIGGARGGGGSNWTGSWTGTVQVTMVCQ
jgi:hypothetical protein